MMQHNVETILSGFAQIRRAYANHLHLTWDGRKLSPNEISILILLSNNRSIDTAGQFTILLGVSKSLISRSIESLLRNGLLTEASDQKDARVRHFSISPTAAPLITSMQQEIATLNQILFHTVTQEELVQMEVTIKKILACFAKLEMNEL